MSYTANQKIYVPGHGIGVYKENKTLDGSADGRQFMVIDIEETGVRIMVPENSPKAKALRQPLEKPQAETILATLKSTKISNIDNKTRWHRRHKEQVQTLESGNSLDIAMLVKSLAAEKSNRSLSFSETKMLEDASLMIKTELQYALGEDFLQDPEVAEVLMAA
jgi:RNA polymerase-interacting CarD/CdnL/TRCF family regulator